LDYIDYTVLTADQSYGSLSDGNPFPRQLLAKPTPATANQSAPAIGPRITALIDSTRAVKLTWPTEINVRYKVQSTAGLSNAVWTTAFEAIGTGSPQSFVDAPPIGTHERYYRIVRE
jgi:hypothetical protein